MRDNLQDFHFCLIGRVLDISADQETQVEKQGHHVVPEAKHGVCEMCIFGIFIILHLLIPSYLVLFVFLFGLLEISFAFSCLYFLITGDSNSLCQLIFLMSLDTMCKNLQTLSFP